MDASPMSSSPAAGRGDSSRQAKNGMLPTNAFHNINNNNGFCHSHNGDEQDMPPPDIRDNEDDGESISLASYGESEEGKSEAV